MSGHQKCPPPMIPTPRTDAQPVIYGTGDILNLPKYVSIEFAKELERELANKERLLGLAAAELPRVAGPVHERIQVYFKAVAESMERYQKWAPTITKVLDEFGAPHDTGDLSECVRGIRWMGERMKK